MPFKTLSKSTWHMLKVRLLLPTRIPMLLMVHVVFLTMIAQTTALEMESAMTMAAIALLISLDTIVLLQEKNLFSNHT